MHKKIVICITLIILLLTGCWDQVEIEDRAQVGAIGIDKYIPSSENNEDTGGEQTEKGGESDRFVYTLAFPKHDIEELSNIVVSSVGDSLYSISRSLTDRTSWQMGLGHLRVVVLNSDIVRNEESFRKILYEMEDNEFINRRVILTMTDEPAGDIINVNPEMNPILGRFISEIFTRKDRTPRAPKGDISSILQDIHESGNTLIPKIVSGEKDVEILGAGIINNYEFVGWLDELDTTQVMIFKGEADIAGVTVPDYKGINIPIDAQYKGTNLRLVEDEDNIKIVAEVKAEGDIKRTYFEGTIDALNPDVIKDIEKAACDTVKKQMESAIDNVQKEFKTDVLNIDRFLRQYHYDLWEEVRGDWDEIFPNIDIEVEVNLKIRRVGLGR